MSEQTEVLSQQQLEPQGSVQLPESNPIKDAEWCFQFFNNEPIVFAFSKENEDSGNLVLELKPLEGEGLNFKQNGMEFRIFARPISEETKLERQKQTENEIR